LEIKAFTQELSQDGGLRKVYAEAKAEQADAHTPASINLSANLTKVQGLLLLIHYRLGHMGFGNIQRLARLGVFPKSVTNCIPPICAFCLIDNTKKATLPNADTGHVIDAEDLTYQCSNRQTFYFVLPCSYAIRRPRQLVLVSGTQSLYRWRRGRGVQACL
jgi:hypothetical protein